MTGELPGWHPGSSRQLLLPVLGAERLPSYLSLTCLLTMSTSGGHEQYGSAELGQSRMRLQHFGGM